MPNKYKKTCSSTASLFLLMVSIAVAAEPARPPDDPLASEVARWSKYLHEMTSTDELWTQIRDVSEPVMKKTEEALRDGRRLLAVQRLAVVREDLSAWSFVSGRPPGKEQDTAAFEAEWARIGKTVRETREAPSPGALEGVRPAAIRGLGEAALHQVRVYYDVSLEYGRNTMAVYGLYYLGVAQAQEEFADFCRSLPPPSKQRTPQLRSLRGEIDAMEHEFLAVYRPPISIDRHSEFIVAHAALKEARELDEAGLRYGALLRYLEAARRFGPLRPASSTAPDAKTLAKTLGDFDTRLSSDGLDHSLGRLYLEAAQADLAAPSPETGPVTAAIIAGDVLPRYFAALKPAARERKPPAPRATVTLVRWPYT